MLAARAPGERRERIAQRLANEIIEERSARGCAEREAHVVKTRACQHRFVEVVPGRQATSRIAEQHLLRLGRRLDALPGRAKIPPYLPWRQQARILRRLRSLFTVHDDDTGHEGLFGDAPRHEREIDRLLNVVREQHEAPCIGEQVNRIVATARGAAVRRRRARRHVQHQRGVLARCGNEQVGRARDVLAGEKCGCAPPGQRQARRRSNHTSRAFRRVR